jgi:branched-chain amino acid transport system substrate-binding protein
MEQIVFPDLNAQMKAIGWGSPTFTVLLEDPNGQANIHLEKVQGFKSMGVTVFQGGAWSSMAQACLGYCNSNQMLMWSSGSTSPTLAIADDYLYRMVPSDSALAPALVDVMWSYGIKTCIIFQRADSWADGIVNLFVPAWTAKGGTISGDKIRYAAEATEYSSYLQIANNEAKAAIEKYGDAERVGIVLLVLDEFPVVATQSADYSAFYSCPAFGGDGTALSQRGMDDAPTQVNHLRCFSLMAQAPESSRYNSLKVRYEALTKQQYNAYEAYAYDIEFVSAMSILVAQSAAGKDVVNLQTLISDNTWGAGGWCQLNQFGDRAPPPYDIWFYAPGVEASTGAAKASISYVGGVYNPDTGATSWNSGVLLEKLGYLPNGP